MRPKFTLLSIMFALAFVALSHAQALQVPYVSIIQPYNATMTNGGSIYLGKVGPGQTFYVTISAATKNSSGTLFPIAWDEINASSLPNGWISQNSPLYTSTPSVKIAVASQAYNGTYGFNITAINVGNYSKFGSVKFTVYVNVTPDVFKLNVTPTSINAGPGLPSTIYVTINNTGVSDSPFNITIHGLPAWNYSSTVIALHHTKGTFPYTIYENTPGKFKAQLYVSSISSQLINRQSNITLITKASVANDYAALGQEALTFPIVYAPTYAVMYLLSLLAKYA